MSAETNGGHRAAARPLIRAEEPYIKGIWLALDEDIYDGPGSPLGIGATREEAIRDLLAQLEEND